MKKYMRICASVAAAVFILAAAGCSDYKTYNESKYSAYNSNDYAVGGVTVEKPVSSLDVDWFCGKVEIKAHDGTSLVFSEEVTSGNSDDEGLKHRYRLAEGALKIKFAASGQIVPSDFNKTLTVLVPQSATFFEVEVNCVSASANLRGLTTDELEFDSVSGGVNISGCKIGEADIGSVSGAVKISDCIVDKIDAGTTSGEVSFSGSAQTIEIGSVSGKVSLSVDNLPTEIEIKSTSGAVVFNPKGERNFKIKYSTTSGKFKSELPNEKDGKYYVFGDGTYKYKVSTTSGDFTVN